MNLRGFAFAVSATLIASAGFAEEFRRGATPQFASPLRKPFEVVRGFDIGPQTSVPKGTYYPGLGFETVPGAFVYAADAGVVARAVKATSGKMKIEIDHGNGWSTVYYYMDEAFVRLGDPVAAGAVIGAVSDDRPALEFDTLKNGAPVSPAAYLDFSKV